MSNVPSLKHHESLIERLLARAKTILHWNHLSLVGIVLYLRWTIPIAVSFVGVLYVLVEDVGLQQHAVTDIFVIRSVLVIGLAGPVLVWLTLTWAAQAAVAEANAQRELALRNKEARRRALYLQTASLIGQRVTALRELETLVVEVARMIRTRFGYYHVQVWLVDGETGALELKGANGASADAIMASGRRHAITQAGLAGYVAQTGQLFLCNDVSQEARFQPDDLLPSIRAELAVPLHAGKQVFGVLDVQSQHVNAFDKEDVVVMQILGNQLGIAIENARLFAETKRRYEAMLALHETSLDMIAQLDMPALLQALLRRGTQLIGAQASTLYLFDEAQRVIRNIANYNTWRDWTGITLQPGEGLAGQVILSGEPLIVNDYDHWSGKAEVFAGTPHTRGIGAPIRHGDHTIGAILVLNDQHARRFDAADVWLLQQFADLASIAIQNAKYHTQIKNFSRELERNVEARTRELSQAKEEIAAQAKQLRLLLAKTIDIQEEERARIARDMHDGVVQLITAARYEMQAARVIAGAHLPAAAQSKLNDARQVLDEAEAEIRHTIYNLHSPILDDVGLVPAMEKYLARFQALTQIPCGILTMGEVCRLPLAIEIAVFRMVEEALHNVAEHSGATTASVVLVYEPGALSAIVQDNGCGFDYAQFVASRNGDHLGLLGMQERSHSLGGEFELISQPGHGTRVMFRLPI